MPIQISVLLDRSRPDTLTNQLADQLRDAIRLGRIAPGARLPSSRRLSEQLGIGRNTVVNAYEMLEMSCFVQSRPASGMFAALPQRTFDRDARPAASARVAAPRGMAVVFPPPVRLSFDFAPGRTDPALFPLKTWRRLLQACLSRNGAIGLSQPADPTGLAALRASIANHLLASRGFAAEPGQIIILSGASEGFALVAKMLLAPGKIAVMESPGDRAAADAFEAAGAVLHGVAVDADGLVAADLPAPPASLLYLTPAHQFPTGSVLSASRRAAIIAWARDTGCIIVEDDLGAEFRYDGSAPPSVAVDAPDCTLHLGSFSQTLGAGLQLAYLVVPSLLVESARAAKGRLGSFSPWLEQAVLAEMINSGSYAAHLMRMRIAYRERRDQLLAALQRNFGDVEISGAAGGLHLLWHLPPGVPDAATLVALGRRARVGVYAPDATRVYSTTPDALQRRGLMLGYAGLAPRQIEQGVARLSDAMDDALDTQHIALSDLLAHRGPHMPGAFPAKPAPRFRHKPALPLPPGGAVASRSRIRRGPSASMPAVTGLYRYPIKGLSPQPIQGIAVEAGRPFPFDRIFALARPGVAVTAEEPKWAKKGLFVMLMLDEGLATVRTHLDERTMLLTVMDGERPVLSADIGAPEGRARVETFFQRLAPTLRAPPVLVRAREGHFMDKPDNVISLINLATLRSLEDQWGTTLDKLRFRANVYIDGAAPWEEFEWVGSDIRIGDGIFRVDRRNGRCGATNVDPTTGRRDRDIPGSLRKAFGHKDLGVYLIARTAAHLRVGDSVDPAVAATVARPPLSRAAPPPGGRNTLICSGCYYIYHEQQGHPGAGITPGTRFADLPADWQCPDCGTDKTKFRPHQAAVLAAP